MAVEAGATSGICLPDRTTVDYLWPFIGPGGDKSYPAKEAALED
jgi:3-isopropylmalate/(R)-2-methylmalate dehydratase large subunit